MARVLVFAVFLQTGDPAADGMRALEGQRDEDAAPLFAQAATGRFLREMMGAG